MSKDPTKVENFGGYKGGLCFEKQPLPKPGALVLKPLHWSAATEQYLLCSLHVYELFEVENPVTKEIFETYKHSNIYKGQNYNDWFGSRLAFPSHITQLGDKEKNQRPIIGLFTQLWPSQEIPKDRDRPAIRWRNFVECMNKVYKSVTGLESIAIPQDLCHDKFNGWYRYQALLTKFAQKYPSVKTVVYMGDVQSKFKKQAEEFSKLF